MKKRRIMGRDSSGGVGELIFVLIILVLGAAVIRKMRENNASHRDFPDSDSPGPEKIPEAVIPKVKVLPLKKQITHRKKENEIIDVRKVVKPNPLPYHLEKGWQKERKIYQGYYRCRLGAFRGEIEERFDGHRYYIFNPPQKLLTDPKHAPCFTNVGGSRYHIHFGVNSNDLDGGIIAVERILFQSLNRR